MKNSIIILFLLCLVGLVSCKKDTPKELVLEYGTVTDIEGNTYKTVKIDDQWWMCENLKTTLYNDGSAIPFFAVNDTTGWQLSDGYKSVNDSLYGCLYNYASILDQRGLAPEGWHIATDGDWNKLERSIGMDSTETELMAWRGQDEVNGILPQNSNNWPISSLHFGNNKYALNINPGGIVLYNGMLSANSYEAYFWTATHTAQQAMYRSISYQRTQIFRQYADMRYGMSVRCVKN
jgi:uncharacterized protein (TIGR02145 family)